MASPTSTAAAAARWRLPLPVTSRLCGVPGDVVDRQRRHLAAPQPQPASTVRIAKSRRPVPVRRSQPANIRATSSAATARTAPRSRQLGATGTTSTSGAEV